MSYLPGVPDMGPKPVSTSPAGSKATIGKPTGIAAVAHSVGKPGSTQHLGNLSGRTGKGMTAIGGGSQGMHSMNHYGKAGASPSVLGTPQTAGGNDPTQHAGAKMIRGGSGGMRSHIREGGLGPGPMATPGSADDYSMNSQDTE